MRDIGAGVSPIAELDRGEWRSALERYDAGEIPDGAEGQAWAACVEAYRDCPAESIRRLDALAADDVPAALTYRVPHLRAVALLGLGQLDECERIEAEVWREARDAGDLATAAWAAIAWVRCAIRRGDARDALNRLTEVRPLMMAFGSRAAEGFFLACEANALLQLREIARGLPVARRAVDLLSEHDGARWEAIARNTLGLYLVETGAHGEALAEHERAEQIAVSLGLVSDVLAARNNAARALIFERRYAVARERLRRQSADHRDLAPAAVALAVCSYFLEAVAAILEGDYEAAERAAEHARRFAGERASYGNEEDTTLTLTWARALKGEAGARARLADLAEQAHMLSECADEALASAAVFYTLASDEPARAAEWEQRARRILSRAPSALSETILDEARRRQSTALVAVDRLGRLVVDLRRPDLPRDEILAAVERHLLRVALERAGGSPARAARVLGVDRTTVTKAWERLTGVKLRRPGRD
jgi:tetratricopeptide (TPR) repeat protein